MVAACGYTYHDPSQEKEKEEEEKEEEKEETEDEEEEKVTMYQSSQRLRNDRHGVFCAEHARFKHRKAYFET